MRVQDLLFLFCVLYYTVYMKLRLPVLTKPKMPRISFSPAILFYLVSLGVLAGIVILTVSVYQGSNTMLRVQKTQTEMEINRLLTEIQMIKSEDQYVRNEALAAEIKNIQTTYKQAVGTYEELIELRALTRDTGKLEERLADSLNLLSQRNWSTASSQMAMLSKDIVSAKEKVASSFVIPVNVPENNTAPASGFSRQSVKTDVGTFLVDIVAADMGSTRIIVDTASDSTCTQDCPAMSLGDYVSRSGAFAGINGSYFCPADYPSCADKKNSFDTLLMNINKVYFNSDNNVYSTVPVVVFLSGSMRFIGRSLDWGRDTGPDGVLAMQPLLVSGGNNNFGGDSDPKKGSRGSRSFVGNKGSTAYIGVVHNATVAEVAHALKTMGLENALNLDSGGSTALWSGGYKVGPGRNIPNAILFVRK